MHKINHLRRHFCALSGSSRGEKICGYICTVRCQQVLMKTVKVIKIGIFSLILLLCGFVANYLHAQDCSFTSDCGGAINCGNPCTITVGQGTLTGVNQDPVCVARKTVIKFVQAKDNYLYRINVVNDPTNPAVTLFNDQR